MQLQPKRYSFIQEGLSHISLPEGEQIGLISQEVEDVFPALVTDVIRPAQVDSLGETIVPEMTFKAMNYDGLIPVLIAAVKHQQTQIADQAATNAALTDQVSDLLDRMDAMEQLFVACCQNPAGSDQRNLIDDGIGDLDQNSGDRNLRIQPNPFTERTTVYYNLERRGRMQLMANSSDGKQLRVLHEAQMEQGEYQYEWQTADLAPGIYYVTLLLDGEPIVKKAVKVR